MLVPSALQASVQNKATWSKFSIHFFDSCKLSKISFSTHCSKPFHVAVSLLSFQSKDSYFSLTHSHLSVSTLQVNNDNGTSSMQICENVAEEEENNEKKEVMSDRNSYVEAESRNEDHQIEENRRRCGGYGNKGKVPWNKRRKHSEETKGRIRERTKKAMEDPKIREKLRIKAEGCILSSETKLKIKTAIMNIWESKRKLRQRQESCMRDWTEAIAESARRGGGDDVEHEWDGYNLILAELRAERRRQRQRRKKDPSSSKSFDHRLKISEAIRAKWADPDYRIRVKSGFCGYLSNHGGRPVRKSGKVSDRVKDKARIELRHSVVINKSPQAYKDPSIVTKLAKLKQVQASRHSTRQEDFTEQARILIKEANTAATALEAMASQDKITLYSILESRRLLAKAARSIESALAMRNSLH